MINKLDRLTKKIEGGSQKHGGNWTAARKLVTEAQRFSGR
jgi:hypothetical protein